MFRLIRPLRIIEGKFFIQNVKMSSPTSQSHVYDMSKVEKKELDTENINIKHNAPIEGKEAEGNSNYLDPSIEEFVEKLSKTFSDRPANFGGSLYQNIAMSSEQHLNSATPDMLIQYLKHLASKKQRPTILIKNAVEKLTATVSGFTLLQCSMLLYSLSKLCYRDENLIKKISENIKTQKSEFKEGILPVSMLQSFGMLKYRNCEVIDILLQCILKHKDVRTPNEKLTALMTLALVNYVSPLGTAVLQEMLEFDEKEFTSTKSYLDFVWASVILNHLSEKHISSVLSDEFVSRLLLSAGSSGYDICSLKLLNINAAAQTLMKGYTKSLLNRKFSTTLHQSKSKMEFTRLVVDGLVHLFPNNKDIRVNIDTGAGFILDVEYCNNNNVHKKSRNFFENDDDKVGIILLGYNDICFDEAKTVTGLNTFKQRILEAKNYKIVNIPYTEYNENMKLFEKIQYLQEKLKNLLKI